MAFSVNMNRFVKNIILVHFRGQVLKILASIQRGKIEVKLLNYFCKNHILNPYIKARKLHN